MYEAKKPSTLIRKAVSMRKKAEYTPDNIDKTHWVQLKTMIPKPLRTKLKIEAATLDKTLESYLLALFDQRRDTYDKLLAAKKLDEKTRKQK